MGDLMDIPTFLQHKPARTEAITNPIITAFLERAATKGFHLRPDEATEAMSEAGVKASPAGDMTTGGPDDAYRIVWRAMGRVAPVYGGLSP